MTGLFDKKRGADEKKKRTIRQVVPIAVEIPSLKERLSRVVFHEVERPAGRQTGQKGQSRELAGQTHSDRESLQDDSEEDEGRKRVGRVVLARPRLK